MFVIVIPISMYAVDRRAVTRHLTTIGPRTPYNNTHIIHNTYITVSIVPTYPIHRTAISLTRWFIFMLCLILLYCVFSRTLSRHVFVFY